MVSHGLNECISCLSPVGPVHILTQLEVGSITLPSGRSAFYIHKILFLV
jgi:hypothetical protein